MVRPMPSPRPNGTRPTPLRPAWARLGREELLELRFDELGLGLEGTALERRVERLYAELRGAGLRFRPYVWLSTDWFTPDGATGFAIPFFLAHPRLARLERRTMLEVEGGTAEWCLRLLRHETAHALDHAYRLHRRKSWREVFGPASTPYRSSYAPNPASKRFVLNLGGWYSQSHPIEDFAETFAVWLDPSSRWREAYAGWGALEKLRFVDELMGEIAERRQAVRTRERPESLASLRTKLREHYRQKQVQYDVDLSGSYDPSLERVFRPGPRGAGEPAATFLQRHRRELRKRIASVTGQTMYLVDQLLGELVLRCRQLGLRRTRSETESLVDAAVLLTSVTTSLLHGAHPHYRR
jgi:hypothetical protein